jgi:galactonate dehydratase
MLSRRQFTTAAALSSLAPIARPAAGRLEIFGVPVNHRGQWVLARLTTPDGVSGIGDASHGGRDQETVRHLREFFELFGDRRPADIESFRAAALPAIAGGGLPAAVAFSALEQCLWDILGKMRGVPACDLLGGRLRTDIRNYANINRSVVDRTPAGFASMAEKAVAAGFDAVKLAPFDGMPPRLTDPEKIEHFAQLGLACTQAVRKAIGARDLLIDVHSRFDRERGLDLTRRMEPFELFWLEEVTPLRDIESLAAIDRAARMRTAGGEALFGAKGFLPHVNAGTFDIFMPDVKYCGGVLELKKIAALCEAGGRTVAPHGPASPVGNMAAAHVCAGLPNFEILEFAFGEVPWRAELVDPPEQLAKGRLTVPARPGFGIALNESEIRRRGTAL